MHRLAAMAALCLTLVACGGSAEIETRALTSAAPDFSRIERARWSGPGPDAYPVHGIDIARYQPPIDWRQAKAAGVSFAFIKATEGGDMVDPMFAQHWDAAGRAGVPRGAYHFWYHCRPAVEQARWFIDTVPRGRRDLPHVLDMEWTPFSPTCTIRRDGAFLRAEAKTFLDMLERHYGKRPVIYVSVDFYRDAEFGKMRGETFWLRSVAAHPSVTYPGQDWRFWQYTGTGRVPGVTGEVDINVFSGSPAAFRAWAG